MQLFGIFEQFDWYEQAKLSSHNITHNLNKMAEAVGLYKVLWYPGEIGITSASRMIDPLEKGIKELQHAGMSGLMVVAL